MVMHAYNPITLEVVESEDPAAQVELHTNLRLACPKKEKRSGLRV